MSAASKRLDRTQASPTTESLWEAYQPVMCYLVGAHCCFNSRCLLSGFLAPSAALVGADYAVTDPLTEKSLKRGHNVRYWVTDCCLILGDRLFVLRHFYRDFEGMIRSETAQSPFAVSVEGQLWGQPAEEQLYLYNAVHWRADCRLMPAHSSSLSPSLPFHFSSSLSFRAWK